MHKHDPRVALRFIHPFAAESLMMRSGNVPRHCRVRYLQIKCRINVSPTNIAFTVRTKATRNTERQRKLRVSARCRRQERKMNISLESWMRVPACDVRSFGVYATTAVHWRQHQNQHAIRNATNWMNQHNHEWMLVTFGEPKTLTRMATKNVKEAIDIVTWFVRITD